jgi:hypothetical protein
VIAERWQVLHDLRRRERVADPRSRERESLRHRSRHDDVRMIGHERETRGPAELDVRLVDDDQRVGASGERRDRRDGLRVARRVVRRADEDDVRSRVDDGGYALVR